MQSPRMRLKNARFMIVIAITTAVVSPSAVLSATADDIPHENYDLVGSNLDFVIALLRSSIRYSEHALESMYNESMTSVDQNLTIVREVLIPAERLLSDIKNVAGSYENLSLLLPPFAQLSGEMDSFASMEKSLLQSRSSILLATQLENLTDEQLLQALEAIRNVNSLINRMNRTIDDMLVSANAIIALEVEGTKPFTDNQLIPLIERLRDLLLRIEIDVDYAVTNEIPWITTRPFLLLWLSSDEYYLDEAIIGGGYLFYNGSFVPNHLISILMDGADLVTSMTSGVGSYGFAYQIPLDSSWLGYHDLQATSVVDSLSINSSSVQIRIILIPTIITLSLSANVLSPDEILFANVSLKDLRGHYLSNAQCRFILDGDNITFATDSQGRHSHSWSGSGFTFGAHAIQAVYDEELPHAASASPVVAFDVNIPTRITLDLVNNRIFRGYFVVGDGVLYANYTQALGNQKITISIDDLVVLNATTDSIGRFSFSLPTDELSIGAHTLRAELLDKDVAWRYSAEEVGFTVYGKKVTKYPFFPSIPGWGGLGPPDTIVYLFIGPNSYYFWLLLLLFTGIVVKTYQMSSRRKSAVGTQRRQAAVILERVPLPLVQPKPSADEFAMELGALREGRASPNERVIWFYQRLLSFLTRRDNLPLKSSMTHLEVARLLKSFGYPQSPVDKATSLFETALYSGTDLSDTDTVVMSSTLTSLVGVKKAGGA